MQKVEGVVYSPVMITGNLRRAIEGLFAVVFGSNQLGLLRYSGILAGLCVAFEGATTGAFATRRFQIWRSAFPCSPF